MPAAAACLILLVTVLEPGLGGLYLLFLILIGLVAGGIGVLIAAALVGARADHRKIRELKERARLRMNRKPDAKTKQSRGP